MTETTKTETTTGRFDVMAICGRALPETAKTLLVDTYLTDRDSRASARVFRVYRPTPAHYHATCDEYLYVLSGRGTFLDGKRDGYDRVRDRVSCSVSQRGRSTPSRPFWRNR